MASRSVTPGLIGLRMATAWLACCVQARCGQSRHVLELLDWCAYACIQAWFRRCLVARTSSAKVIFCVCTFSHTHTHALALAAAEPGSRETVIPSFLWSLAESSLLHACSLVEGERVLILNEIGLQGDYIYIGLRDQGSMV